MSTARAGLLLMVLAWPSFAASQAGSFTELVPIPAGAFTMGSASGPDDERPEHRIELPAFAIERTSVTNRQFAEALYVNTLGRAADQADYWTAQLDAGMARSTVVLAFSESAEHINLTASNIGGKSPGEFGILFA